MPFHSAAVLALVLCLGQTINTQQGSPSQPSISAEPGLLILVGHFVNFTCSNANGYNICRLEKGKDKVGEKKTQLSKTEVIFQLGPVNESTAGHYSCICFNGTTWSSRSQILELKVTSEIVSKAPPDPGPTVTSGSPSQPSISAEPGLLILIGHFVNFTCSNANGYNICRLEKGEVTVDEKNIQLSKTEVIFQLGPVNESTAGHYACICSIGASWSNRSQILELKVTSEIVSKAPPDPGPTVTSDTPWLKTDGIYILVAVSVGFLLCFLFIFCFHSYRQKKQGLPNSKSQQQSARKRLSLVTNGLERIPDIVTEDRLPEEQKTETRIPVEGSLQEVTYVQLDHHALTQRTVQAVTPRSTDTMTESSTYAFIIRH